MESFVYLPLPAEEVEDNESLSVTQWIHDRDGVFD